jgi:hypothetical protein
MASPLRSLLLVLALPLGLALVAPGCARQHEGERCNRANGNLDCQSPGTGLLCTVASDLRGGDDKVDRCCPPRGETITDTRCERRVSGGTGGGSGEGGAAGSPGEGGDTGVDLGAACNYNSECRQPYVCGPGGQCQYECLRNPDCLDGKVCEDTRCVAASAGGAGS